MYLYLLAEQCIPLPRLQCFSYSFEAMLLTGTLRVALLGLSCAPFQCSQVSGQSNASHCLACISSAACLKQRRLLAAIVLQLLGPWLKQAC